MAAVKNIMAQFPTLETPRLILRPFASSDAKEVQCLAGDCAIADTTQNIPHPYEDGMAETWISKHQGMFEQQKGVTFAITYKSNGVLIGAISLVGISKGHQAELGYWIGKPYWNQGICTEAGYAVLQYAFSVIGLVRVHSCHISRNPASGRVLKKLSMQYEGSRKQHVKKGDKCEDLELYGILKHEFEEAANKSVKPTAGAVATHL